MHEYIGNVTKAMLRVHNKLHDPVMLAPEGTTPADFLRFLGVMLPWHKWPEYPMDNVTINAIRRALHPDKQQEPTNPFGKGIVEDTMILEWYKVYEQSVQQMKEWWKNASQAERDEFLECWKKQREDILASLLLGETPILWFLMQYQEREICDDIPIQL
jgi:hypothetical protein